MINPDDVGAILFVGLVFAFVFLVMGLGQGTSMLTEKTCAFNIGEAQIERCGIERVE